MMLWWPTCVEHPFPRFLCYKRARSGNTVISWVWKCNLPYQCSWWPALELRILNRCVCCPSEVSVPRKNLPCTRDSWPSFSLQSDPWTTVSLWYSTADSFLQRTLLGYLSLHTQPARVLHPILIWGAERSEQGYTISHSWGMSELRMTPILWFPASVDYIIVDNALPRERAAQKMWQHRMIRLWTLQRSAAPEVCFLHVTMVLGTP